jgi:hypothetical protein
MQWRKKMKDIERSVAEMDEFLRRVEDDLDEASKDGGAGWDECCRLIIEVP